jgi:cytochrome c oxidase subunit II
MFSGPTAYAENVDNVMLIIIGISVILLLGIIAAMVIFSIKYSKKRHPVAKQIEGHVGLEVLWILIPTAIAVFMFFYGYTGYRELREKSDAGLKVEVTGQMWQWKFKYPNGKQTDTLYIPVDEVTRLEMHSNDVNHSFYIPAFRLKEDVIGNDTTFMILTPKEIGTFDIACAEYCGLKHSAMYTALKVVSKDDFNKWLNEGLENKDSTVKPLEGGTKSDSATIQADTVKPVAQGPEIPDKTSLIRRGCISCHSLDGSVIKAPSFKGLVANRQTVIRNGREMAIKVNDKYIKNSVVNPDLDLVKGYSKGSMPNQYLSDEDVKIVVAALKALN